MTTNVSIASQALLLLRASTISSFSDDTNEAEIVKTMYTPFIQGLLSIYPWTFATKKERLTQETTDPINEYSYSHVIPAETLLLWALFNTANVGAKPINDYDIYAAEGGRRVYSNYTTLYADYTAYVTENNWPSYFESFAINALAAHLAIPVTGSTDIAAYYDKVAYGSPSANRKGGLFGVAVSTDSKQKRNEYIVDSPLISARFS